MKQIVLLAFLLLATVARADTITLKDGRELKGDVIEDGPDGVLIDYFVTATIKDQKLVSKEDISKLSVIPADEKAFADLGSLTSPSTVLDTSFYDVLIEKKIPEFFAKYPYSRRLAELRKNQETLVEERSRVRQGDRKIDGSWITSSEIESDPYQITARIQFATMKDKAQENDPVAVLQGYEMIEKSYPGARVMPQALDTALLQMDVLQDKLNQALTNYDILDKKRQKAIAYAPADQAKEIKDAMDKDAAIAKAAAAAAQLDGTKFFPVFPNSKEALDALKAVIDSERTRLLTLQKTPMRDGLAATDAASKLAAAGKTQQAQEQLTQAQKLWPANRDIIKLTTQLDQMAKADAAEAARLKALPSATPSPKK
jgi:hypothetical protein